MVVAGSGGAVSRFENDVTFTVPDVSWITSVPRPNMSRTHSVSEPLLNKVATVSQVTRTQRGAGPAATGHPGEAWNVLVVGAADVPAGFSHLGQVDAVWRWLDPTGLQVVAPKCWSSHDLLERIIYAYRRAADGKKGAGGAGRSG